MEAFKSGHYVGTWGPLLSNDGELFSLPDVIRVVMLARALPHIDAAHSVLTSIKDDAQARCYITRPARFAVPITRPAVWPAPPAPSALNGRKKAKPSVAGPTNLATLLRSYFRHLLDKSRGVGGFGDDDLYAGCAHGPSGPNGQLAILGADASRLFRVELDTVLGPTDVSACNAKETTAAQAPSMEATKKPGERWAGHVALLLRQFDYLTEVEGLKAYQADERLAGIWQVGESNIKQARLKARRSSASPERIAA